MKSSLVCFMFTCSAFSMDLPRAFDLASDDWDLQKVSVLCPVLMELSDFEKEGMVPRVCNCLTCDQPRKADQDIYASPNRDLFLCQDCLTRAFQRGLTSLYQKNTYSLLTIKNLLKQEE